MHDGRSRRTVRSEMAGLARRAACPYLQGAERLTYVDSTRPRFVRVVPPRAPPQSVPRVSRRLRVPGVRAASPRGASRVRLAALRAAHAGEPSPEEVRRLRVG